MFDLEKFDLKLSTETIGRNFIYAYEVSSTNSELLNGEDFYNSHGSVLLAEKQTEGRGRKDRVWDSPPEMNLTFSILITENKYLKKHLNIISYVSSLSVALAVENLYQLRAELKWPNDILVCGKKIAGILLESVSEGNIIKRLVVGIGLNVNQVSFQSKYKVPPTSIKREVGHLADRERSLAEILNIFETILESSLKQSNKILDEWKSKCNLIGERITVQIDDVTKQGIFHDIDEKGYLLLRTKNKVETLHIGDISII